MCISACLGESGERFAKTSCLIMWIERTGTVSEECSYGRRNARSSERERERRVAWDAVESGVH